MIVRRTVVLACVLAAAAATLVGCQKPTPNVTVWAGTSSDHREARCWAYEPNGTIDGTKCGPDAAELRRPDWAHHGVPHGNP